MQRSHRRVAPSNFAAAVCQVSSYRPFLHRRRRSLLAAAAAAAAATAAAAAAFLEEKRELLARKKTFLARNALIG